MSETISCLPLGICSWNFELQGTGVHGSLEFNWGSEQGRIICNGDYYEIVKHGPFSGHWTMEKNGHALCTARKSNPFTRSFEILYPSGEAKLEAESMFSRAMILSGAATYLQIAPAHPFTRRATITGDWQDFEHVAFAFWLTVITWRRAARRNAS